MIYVNGEPLSPSSSKGYDVFSALLEHPELERSVNSFKRVPEVKVSMPKDSRDSSFLGKLVYVFQREYATVDPALAEFAGSDEATTCVCLVIRNPQSGLTSVAHLDSPRVVYSGIQSMLSLLINDSNVKLEVHLIGGYDDHSYEHADHDNASQNFTNFSGYSWPLCIEIAEVLQNSVSLFDMKTLCVLAHNSWKDSKGSSHPIFTGFLVETSTGSVSPACFDGTSKVPDAVVRRLRITISSGDPSPNGKLLETYDTSEDNFRIPPFTWDLNWKYFAFQRLQYSDSQLLQSSSSSPDDEPPDFVENQRRMLKYLLKYPDWRETFPLKKPRIFRRGTNEEWVRCE